MWHAILAIATAILLAMVYDHRKKIWNTVFSQQLRKRVTEVICCVAACVLVLGFIIGLGGLPFWIELIHSSQTEVDNADYQWIDKVAETNPESTKEIIPEILADNFVSLREFNRLKKWIEDNNNQSWKNHTLARYKGSQK